MQQSALTPPMWGENFITLTTKKFTRFSRLFWLLRMVRSVFWSNVLRRRRLPGGCCQSCARELLWNGGVLFSAFGQPGSITRFCVIWRNVTSLQLIYVASPDWTSRNHTHIDTSGPKTFDNNGRHPFRVTIMPWSKIKGIACIADLLRSCYLSYGSCRSSCCNLAASLTCLPWAVWAGEGSCSLSILVRIWRPFSNSLGE